MPRWLNCVVPISWATAEKRPQPMHRWWSARPRRISAGPATTTTRWPARWWPATSSSAAPRQRAATTRSSTRSPICAAGFPDRRGRRRRIVRDHQARRDGRAVTLGTVTAQLLYEIAGPRYAGPDVTTRFDTIELTAARARPGAHQRRAWRAAPPTLKVSLNTSGGFRNQVEFVLTGLDIDAKADSSALQIGRRRAGRRSGRYAYRPDDAAEEEQASALLRCVVRGPDPKRSGGILLRGSRTGAGQLSRFPPHRAARRRVALGVFTAGYVDAKLVEHVAVLPDGRRVAIEPAAESQELAAVDEPTTAAAIFGRTRSVPLGTVVGARSGDKGGSANIGDGRDPRAWPWRPPRSPSTDCANCCPRRQICRSPGTPCRICTPSTSSSTDCSVSASPTTLASTRRPRRSVSGCARGIVYVPEELL